MALVFIPEPKVQVFVVRLPVGPMVRRAALRSVSNIAHARLPGGADQPRFDSLHLSNVSPAAITHIVSWINGAYTNETEPNLPAQHTPPPFHQPDAPRVDPSFNLALLEAATALDIHITLSHDLESSINGEINSRPLLPHEVRDVWRRVPREHRTVAHALRYVVKYAIRKKYDTAPAQLEHIKTFVEQEPMLIQLLGEVARHECKFIAWVGANGIEWRAHNPGQIGGIAPANITTHAQVVAFVDWARSLDRR